MPYLWRCNRSNTSDKLQNTKNVQKTKFEVAEMILDRGTNKWFADFVTI